MPTTAIDPKAFEAALRKAGFDEVLTREIKPGFADAEHHHDYDVRALMLTGSLALTCDGKTTTYRAGEIFELDAGRRHSEQFGPDGSSYIVGRRHPRKPD